MLLSLAMLRSQKIKMITITLPVRIDLTTGGDGPSCSFTVENVLFDESPKNSDMVIFTDVSSNVADRVLFSVEHLVHYVNPE